MHGEREAYDHAVDAREARLDAARVGTTDHDAIGGFDAGKNFQILAEALDVIARHTTTSEAIADLSERTGQSYSRFPSSSPPPTHDVFIGVARAALARSGRGWGGPQETPFRPSASGRPENMRLDVDAPSLDDAAYVEWLAKQGSVTGPALAFLVDLAREQIKVRNKITWWPFGR